MHTHDRPRAVARQLPCTVLTLLAAFAVPHAEASLIGLYTFDSGTAVDESGNGNHATSNTATFLATGGLDGSGAFDFAASSIVVPIDINASALPALTMGAWVNADTYGSGSAGKVLSHDNGSFDRSLGIDFREGTGSSPPPEYAAYSGVGVAQGGAVGFGTWQFIAVRYDGTSMTLDVDGARRTVADSTDLDIGLTSTWIGVNPTFGEFFDGLIDNVFFFDEYLADSAIDAIRTGGTAELLRIASPVPEPGTLVLGLLGMAAVARARRGSHRAAG
ncbi:MAG: PEP-CTERM sorting domain-containing protein [Planctomycetes bacterium]|nr:PEP-CTERM sorting domain-containing protein [Planctomycetota bacterium]